MDGLDGLDGYLQTGPFLDHLAVITNVFEMLVAPWISQAPGLPWFALVCYSLLWSAIDCLTAAGLAAAGT